MRILSFLVLCFFCKVLLAQPQTTPFPPLVEHTNSKAVDIDQNGMEDLWFEGFDLEGNYISSAFLYRKSGFVSLDSSKLEKGFNGVLWADFNNDRKLDQITWSSDEIKLKVLDNERLSLKSIWKSPEHIIGVHAMDLTASAANNLLVETAQSFILLDQQLKSRSIWTFDFSGLVNSRFIPITPYQFIQLGITWQGVLSVRLFALDQKAKMITEKHSWFSSTQFTTRYSWTNVLEQGMDMLIESISEEGKPVLKQIHLSWDESGIVANELNNWSKYAMSNMLSTQHPETNTSINWVLNPLDSKSYELYHLSKDGPLNTGIKLNSSTDHAIAVWNNRFLLSTEKINGVPNYKWSLIFPPFQWMGSNLSPHIETTNTQNTLHFIFPEDQLKNQNQFRLEIRRDGETNGQLYPAPHENWNTLSFPKNSFSLNNAPLGQIDLKISGYRVGEAIIWEDTIISILNCQRPDYQLKSSYCPNEIIDIILPPTYHGRWKNKKGIISEGNSLNWHLKDKTDTIIYEFSRGECHIIDTLIFPVESRPELFPDIEEELCYGDTLQLKFPTSSNNIFWNSTATIYKSNILKYDYTLIKTEKLYLRTTSDNSCIYTDSLQLNPVVLPEPSIPELSLCPGEQYSIAIESYPDINYRWETEDGHVIKENRPIEGIFIKDTSFVAVNYSRSCTRKSPISLHFDQYLYSAERSEYQYCPGEKIDITGTPWQNTWFDKYGNKLGEDSILSFSPHGIDSVLLKVTKPGACEYSSWIRFQPLSIPERIPAINSCIGDLINLPVLDDSYQYVDSINFYPTGSDYYAGSLKGRVRVYYQFINEAGCSLIDHFIVEPFPSVASNWQNPYYLCNSESDTFAPSWTQWEWLSVNFNDREVTQFPYLIQPTDTLLSWTGVDKNGCFLEGEANIQNFTDHPVFEKDTLWVCPNTDYYLPLSSDTLSELYATYSNFSFETNDLLKINTSKNDWLYAQRIGVGCSYTDSIRLQIKETPFYELSIPNVICEGQIYPIRVNTHEDLQLNWFSGTGELLSSTNRINWKASIGDSILLRVFEGSCTYDRWIKPQVISIEAPETSHPSFVCPTDSVINFQLINPNPSLNYSWFNIYGDQLGKGSKLKRPVFPQKVILTSRSTFCNRMDTLEVLPAPKFNSDIEERVLCPADSLQLTFQVITEESENELFTKWYLIDSQDQPQFIKQGEMFTLKHPQPDRIQITTTLSSDFCLYDTLKWEINTSKNPNLPTFDTLYAGVNEQITVNYEAYQFADLNLKPKWLIQRKYGNQIDIKSINSSILNWDSKDSLGCSYSWMNYLKVEDQLFIPDLFSPNGDGVNDLFRIYGSGLSSALFQISDPSGRILFTSKGKNPIEVYWTGELNGDPLPEGIYLWSISGHYSNGKEITYRGKTIGYLILKR